MTLVVDAPTPVLETPPVPEDELTELALAADPDQPLAADAVPWRADASAADGLLPDWYMPAGVTRQHKPWQVATVLVIITAFAMINALGLCITYGHLVPA